MRRLVRTLAALLAVLALWLAGAGDAAAQSSGQSPLAGSRVFGAKGCAKCHAINGVGPAVGPDLGRIPRPRSFYDLAAAMWNHLPSMARRMREGGVERPRLRADEAADLVGFLYTLGYFNPPGDPEAGRRLFTVKRCIGCHQVAGVGGVVGPSLDGIRALASPMFLTAAMWNHGPQMARVMRERGVERPTFTEKELLDLVAYLVPTAGAPEEGPLHALPGRAERGRQLFAAKRCRECHAAAGAGGAIAPDLARRGVRKTPIEFAAAMWNKAPMMLAAMAARGVAVPQLSPDEVADIVAYLQGERYFAEPGEAFRGLGVATRKGCLGCHSVRGEATRPGGALAGRVPDSPTGLTAALWNHVAVSEGVGTTAWPKILPEEVADLEAWLRSLGAKR